MTPKQKKVVLFQNILIDQKADTESNPYRLGIITQENKKEQSVRGVFHKAGFTYHKNKFVGATSGRPRAFNERPYITKGQRFFVSVLFHTPCPARYSVLHLLGVLSGEGGPLLCKGRWIAQRTSLGVAVIICRRQTSFKKRTFVLVDKGSFFLACPTGFEPAASRVGVSRAIQLCHGQILVYYSTSEGKIQPKFVKINTYIFEK